MNDDREHTTPTEDDTALELARLRSLVAQTSLSILSCDEKFVINGFNPGLVALLDRHRAVFEARWPGFDPKKLIGKSMDIFHKDPSRQRGVLGDHSRLPYDAHIRLSADVAFDLRAYPLRDEHGQLIGYNTEWRDASNRTRYASELAKVTEALREGRLDVRFDESRMSGDYAEMARDVNSLVDAIAMPVTELTRVVTSLSQGHSVSIGDMNLEGELGELVEGVERLVERSDSLTESVRRVAEGDLTVEVEHAGSDDAIMESFGEMVAGLAQTIREIRRVADWVQGGSSQVASASQSVSDNSTQSAASIEEVSASAERIAQQTRDNATNAGQALDLANEARARAENGDRQMGSMLVAMKEIGEMSKSISKIVKVIDEIAFQTNLLALNAAVEAGRAGEHGKGFAVVAEEVGRLAARSAAAARETAEIIESTIQKVSGGMSHAEATASSLGEIVAQVNDAAKLVHDIATSSQEQADAISQINIGLTQVDAVTQRNTADAEEMAAAANELAAQAERLKSLLDTFRVREGNATAAPTDLTPEMFAAFQQFMAMQGGGAPKPKGANGHGSNGHKSNGHGSNGHGSNGHGSNGHGGNGSLERFPGDREFGRY